MSRLGFCVGIWLLGVGCSPVYTSADGGNEVDAAAPVEAGGPSSDAGVRDASEPLEAGADATLVEAEAGRPALRVFVTTSSYKGIDLGQAPGGAVVEADRLCGMQARDFGLVGVFRAWINTTTSLARDRIIDIGPWVDAKAGRTVFARNPRTGEGPLVPIPLADGSPPPAGYYAWTGADASGGRSSVCSDWTNGLEPGRFGRPSTPATWADDNEQPCGGFSGHLYCFEVP
jgi:hypothetical protein